ncbi:arginine/ornithine transport protein AotM [Pseudomonas sp. CFII64]|uniref:ABC transporter permease n=1 Tax=Pseudomonas sp. CFII64 TaxID=911242 RepID=UPI00035786B4|nr:ABC transporter permease subunit [Pseudomonas sp. CFII64]EPJ86713.1 arginine/ornithine transport protein AotM [Pseudomonas sp. CFII64]
MHYDLALAWNTLPQLLRGAAMSLAVLMPVLMVGMLIAIPLALRRASTRRRWIAAGYVGFFRGVPSLILLYAIYNGLPQLSAIRNGPLWPLFSNAYFCAVAGLSLTHSAYLAEILRGGLQAVPQGVIEAASALGMRPPVIFWKVRLPIAARHALRAYQNEILIMVKSTAAVGAITLVELNAAANEVFEFTYDPFTPLLTAAAIYWTIINIIRFGFDAAERNLNAGQTRALIK